MKSMYQKYISEKYTLLNLLLTYIYTLEIDTSFVKDQKDTLRIE